jgi:predicted small secreted protein
MKLLKIIALGVVCLFVLSGCNTVGVGGRVSVPAEKQKHKKKGPPRHAPAHGYRHNHQGHDIVYDAKIGAYIVINIPDTYFHNNMYIRLSTDGRWMVSANLNNGWRVESGTEIPHRLKQQKEYEYKRKHKNKKYKDMKHKDNKGQSKKYD